jgi:hypothetical protein
MSRMGRVDDASLALEVEMEVEVEGVADDDAGAVVGAGGGAHAVTPAITRTRRMLAVMRTQTLAAVAWTEARGTATAQGAGLRPSF